MSKKGEPMNRYFQLYNLYRLSTLRDIPIDIGIEDIDSELHLPEHISIFLNQSCKNMNWRNCYV